MNRFLLIGVFLCLCLITFLPKAHAKSEYCVKGQVMVPTSIYTSIYYPGNTPLPYMEITIYDKNSLGQNKLAKTETDKHGNYRVCFKASDTIDEKKDLIVSHKLKNEWISLRDCKACKSYKLESKVIWNVDPGDVDLGVFYFPSFEEDMQYNVAANLFAMGTWAIEHLIDEYKLPIQDQLFKIVYPTGYDVSGKTFYQTIYMGAITDVFIENGLMGFPVNLAISTLFHEIGHAIAYMSDGYSNKTSGYDGGDGSESHNNDTVEYADTAFSEGWAEFISYVILKGLSKPGENQKLLSHDEWTLNDYFFLENRSPNSMRECNEVNVAAVLWDLFDKKNEKQGIVVESYMDSEVHTIEFDDSLYKRLDEEHDYWQSIWVRQILTFTDEYYIVYGSAKYWDEQEQEVEYDYGVYALRREPIEDGSFDDNVIQLFSKTTFEEMNLGSLNSLESYEVTSYAFKDVLYFEIKGDLFRLDLTKFDSPAMKVMSNKMGFLFDFPAGIHAKNINFVRDSRLEGKKHSHILYIYANSTKNERKKLYRLVEQSADGELEFSVEEFGIAPMEDIECLYFHQEQCHFLVSNHPDYSNADNNQLHRYDPKTANTENLWPNSYAFLRGFHYGDFENTIMDISLNNKVLAVDNVVYILSAPGFFQNVVYKLDLKYKTVERFYGFFDTTIEHENYNGMLASIPAVDAYRVMLDGDRLVLTNDNIDFGETLFESIPMYPKAESYVGYCGHDDIQIDLLDLWDHLHNRHNDIIKYTNHLKGEFGGDFDAVLAASWVRPQVCESKTNFETMVHRTLTMDAPLSDI
jgi:hypothetical protein